MHQAVSVIARAIATELGEQWRVDPGCWGESDAVLRSATNEGIHLQSIDGQRRFALSGERGVPQEDLPRHWPWSPGTHNRIAHEITVSATKSPAQIAKDIERRLLPDYRISLAQARVNKRASDEKDAAEVPLVRRLAEILHATIAPAQSHRGLRIGQYGEGVMAGDAAVYDDVVEFQLRVARAEAVNFAFRIASLGTDVNRMANAISTTFEPQEGPASGQED